MIIAVPVGALSDDHNKDDHNKFVAKAAVVDIESILGNSIAIKNIKKSINDISEKIQSDLLQKEIDLKRAENDLIKQRGVLTETEFNKKITEFNKVVNKTQQEMHKRKSALEHAHSEALAEVHEKTIAVIKELSKKYDFNIVFPSSQILFVKNDMNITLEVITKLNERLEKVDVETKLDKASSSN
jgi:Skp family chaperone for outer membrane proteins